MRLSPPPVLFALIGGVVADRFPPHLVLRAVMISSTLVTAVTAILSATGMLSVGLLAAASFLVFAGVGIFYPSYSASLPRLLPVEALLAAKAGATFISPFIGRLDDIGLDGMELIADIRRIYDNYGYETNVLAASIRSVNHIIECARIGADVITAPPAVIKAMASHVLTDKGLEQFNADWAKTGQKIGL